ncbi:MAG: MFS transporter [Gammaproteobacteria bacterium]|nr:MFS transporter [Gammaproteobacteria bacterium]
MFKTALLSSISTALDYYDFVIYILLASFIGPVFFSDHTAFIQNMSVLGVFAIGYVARPLGGFIFGHFADRHGRKKIFLRSILLMAFSTFSIGLLPGYSLLGNLSVALLMGCRLLQGFAQGAEIPAAITFVSEHSPTHKRGRLVGLTLAGAGIGATLASLINTLLLHLLTPSEMHQFGWRIPFLLGGLLAIAGFMIRKKSTEPFVFLNLKHVCKTPLFQTLRQYKIPVLKGMGVIALPGSLILFGLFLPNYLFFHFDYPLRQTYSIFTISLIWSSALIFISGGWVDRFGLGRVFGFLIVFSLILMIPLFKLLECRTDFALWLFLFIYEGLIGLMSGCYPPLLAQLFPTEIRMTGVALSYNLAYLFIGFVPMLALYLIQRTHSAQSVAILMCVMGLISLFSLMKKSTPTLD